MIKVPQHLIPLIVKLYETGHKLVVPGPDHYFASSSHPEDFQLGVVNEHRISWIPKTFNIKDTDHCIRTKDFGGMHGSFCIRDRVVSLAELNIGIMLIEEDGTCKMIYEKIPA